MQQAPAKSHLFVVSFICANMTASNLQMMTIKLFRLCGLWTLHVYRLKKTLSCKEQSTYLMDIHVY